jgi:PAS domain S-box-containing protein
MGTATANWTGRQRLEGFRSIVQPFSPVIARPGPTLIAVLLSIGVASAQPVQELTDRPWQVTSYTEDAGLVGRYVLGLAFEPDGTLWVGASGGLSRYDGYNWRNYTTSNSSLPSSLVRCVLPTRDGLLWVGTDQGAGVFDPKKGTFDRRGSEKGLAGPSVRRIYEDPDGTVWFCADRWPETSTTGGLASWKNGVWTRYRVADGLPSEDAMNYLRGSKGRQFVMTTRGVAERRGERWRPLPEPGLPTGTLVWAMAEAADGTLFAQVNDPRQSVFALRGGQWRSVSENVLTICATPAGEVLAVQFDRQRGQGQLLRWDGAALGAIATTTARLDLTGLTQMGQAPDGSAWLVGRGLLARWQVAGGEWAAYASLPPPRLLDAEGMVWFADDRQAIRRRGSGFETVRNFHGPIWAGGTRGVWARVGTALVRLTQTNRTEFSEADTGLRQINGCVADVRGGTWFHGRDAHNGYAVALFDGRRWIRASAKSQASYRVRDAEPDPKGGIWLVLKDPENRSYELALARDEQITLQSFPGGNPPLSNPNLGIDANGFWLFAFSGLYHLPVDRSTGWRRVDKLPSRGFSAHVGSGDASVFLFLENEGGRAGVAVYRSERWERYFADLGKQSVARFQGEDGRVLFGEEGGFYSLRPDLQTEPDFIPLPVSTAISSLIKDREGNVWVNTPEGVLRYRPAEYPPATRLSSSSGEIPREGILRLDLIGVKRWAPSSAKANYQFSWRVDGAPWSPFSRAETVALRGKDLSPGLHQLAARARNAAGRIDETGATCSFRVLPMPMEQRLWFKLTVGGAILLIGVLALSASQRAQQTAQANTALRFEVGRRQQAEEDLQKAHGLLEERVEQRTQQLSRANAALTREICERKQAQQALRKSEEMFARAFHSSPDSVTLSKVRTGELIEVNDGFERMFGYTRAEVIGKTAVELELYANPEDRGRLLQQLQREGRVQDLEAEGLRKSGEHFSGLMSVETTELEGEPSMVTTVRDITERRRAEAALRESEERLRLAISGANQGLYDMNLHTGSAVVTAEYSRMIGYEPGEVQFTADWWRQQVHPDDLHVAYRTLEECLRGERVEYRMEYRLRTKGGDWKWILSLGKVVDHDPQGRPARLLGTHTDITERKRAEQAVQMFQNSIDQASDAVFWMNRDGGFTYVNDEACRSLGYTREELLRLHLWDIDPVFPKEVWLSQWDSYQINRRGGSKQLETAHHRKNGSVFPVEVVSRHLWLGGQELHMAFARDITERKRTEETLQASLAEKIALLQEVHHRVKNNLQIVSSLLSLQAARVQNPLALSVLQDTRNRVRSMALIHETLYRSENLARVDFPAYVENLCAHLCYAFGVDATRIQLVRHVAGIGLELDEAVPCGLIINELVSNALKHAFPEGRTGQITLELRAAADGQRTLQVADNGVGLPAGIDFRHTKTLGLKLVFNLVDQLNGTLEVERAGGTTFRLTFRNPSHLGGA